MWIKAGIFAVVLCTVTGKLSPSMNLSDHRQVKICLYHTLNHCL